MLNPRFLLAGDLLIAPRGAEVVDLHTTEPVPQGTRFVVHDQVVLDGEGRLYVPVVFGDDDAGCVRLPATTARVDHIAHSE